MVRFLRDCSRVPEQRGLLGTLGPLQREGGGSGIPGVLGGELEGGPLLVSASLSPEGRVRVDRMGEGMWLKALLDWGRDRPFWALLRPVPSVPTVAGLGFGLMSGAFAMINLLADSLGPGIVGIYGDSQLYFLTSGTAVLAWVGGGLFQLPPPLTVSVPTAFMTLVLILLHTFWGIVFFDGCETRRWGEVAAVVLCHLTVSALVSSTPKNGCVCVSE